MTVNFYEGSYQFISKEIEVTGEKGLDEVKEVLKKQFEYRPTTEDLWAVVPFSGMTIHFEYLPSEDKLVEV